MPSIAVSRSGSRRLRRVLAGVLVVSASATVPAVADVSIGIGDQKPAMFTARLFRQLDIRKARIVVPWDVLKSRSQTGELDTWMNAARAADVRPLVTFGHSRRDGRRYDTPTPALLASQLRQLRTRYPWVTEFATWNEPNLCGEPLCHRAPLAARYYDALVTACPRCTILAAEVLDGPTMLPWVRVFMQHVRHQPTVWGLHNYLDANRMRTSGTRALLSAVSGDIWFTETGGIVKRRTLLKAGGFPETVAHAGAAVRWVFSRLVPLSPRIKRVYLYHWNPGARTDSWDSALLGLDGRPRTGYRVLRGYLQSQRRVRHVTRAHAR